MFNGLPVTTTPTYQFWDFSRAQGNASLNYNRISLTDDCAPFQFIYGGTQNGFVYITLPSNPPPGKSITFKADNYSSNTGSSTTRYNFYDASNISAGQGLLYSCQNQVAVTFTYIPELTVLGAYSNTSSCWVMTNTAFIGDSSTLNLYAVCNGYYNRAEQSYTTVGGGTSNVASGSYATVGGGSGNTASNTYCAVGGGTGNTASNTYCTIAGGQSNAASGQYSFVGGGYSNVANGDYSAIPGGYQGTTRSVYGAINYASGMFATRGDAQIGNYAYRLSNATGTIVYLTTDGTGTRSATNQAVISTNNYAYAFRMLIVGRNATNNTDSASFQVTGMIANAGGTVSIVGTPVVTSIGATTGATTAGWAATTTITISADTTNKALSIGITQTTTDTLHWVARVDTIEVG